MITKRGEAPFRSMSHGHNLFNKYKIVYGTEIKFHNKKNSGIKYHVFNHEAPFRPANFSRGTIAKFPEYKPQGALPKPVGKKNSDTGAEKR
jgi:hypothetical protein